MANPIGFSDFFNFGDRDEILQAIRDLKELRTTYKEFAQEVTGKFNGKADGQMQALANEIKAVAEASKQLNVTNQQSQQTLMANLSVIEKLRAENEALRKSREGSRNGEEALAGSVDGLNKKLREQIAEWRKVDQSNEQGAASAKKLAEGIKATKTEINNLNAATKVTTNIVKHAAGSYAELDAQTKKLIADLKAMEGGMGANAGKAQAMQKQIHENTAKLKEFDQQMNHNFRNVGNYASAFNPLNNSINQLSREMPAFAMNARTGFLAISNNLPALSDAIGQITAKNKALRAEGQPTKSVLSQLGGALFSWQTLLSVGITLLTMYGAKMYEWVKAQLSAKKGIDELKSAQEALNAAFESSEYKGAVKGVQDLSIQVNLAKQGLIDKNEVIKVYNESLGKTMGQVTSLGEVEEKLVKAGPAYIRMTLLKAAAQKSMDEAAGIAIENVQKLMSMEGEGNERARKLREENTKIAKMEAEYAKNPTEALKARIKFFSEKRDYARAMYLQTKSTYDAEKKAGEEREASSTRVSARLMKQAAEISKANNFSFTADYKDQAEDAAKAAKDAEAAEKKRLAELERMRKKQDELLKASAAYAIAAAEEEYAKSAQTAQLEIALEQKKLQILKDSFAARSALYAKDSKDWLAIQTEKKKAEADAIESIRKIQDKGIQQRVRNELAALDASMPLHETNYDAEVEFQRKSLAIILQGIADRKKGYQQDSDEYKQLTNDKINAEADAALKIRKINEDREKGANLVRQAQGEKGRVISEGEIGLRVATGKMSQVDADSLMHEQRMLQLGHEVTMKEAALMKMKEADIGYYDAKKALTDAEKNLATEKYNWEIDQAAKTTKKKLEFIQQVMDFTLNAAQSALEIGKGINEGNIEELERAKDRELETVGNNEAAKRAVEEKFNKQTVALRRKQAIADKAMAIFSIGVNTAMAIIAALAPPPNGLGPIKGIPFSIAAGTMGALQIAAVLAKPLPKYAKGRGRKSGYEVAEINEQGVELIERAGQLRVEGRGKRTAAVLHPDDVVHTHERSKRIIEQITERQEFNSFIDSLLQGTRIVRASEDRQTDRIAEAIIRGGISEESLQRAFFSAMKRLPLTRQIYDRNGYREAETTVGNDIKAMNNRNRLGGNG